ncbi:MAG: TetR/AcrR family transcriptional regulator [Lachnospiraceae bacterium]|nr:TetR/AcrR family transcriptional regulator [Lachnospiraceae bacterium]
MPRNIEKDLHEEAKRRKHILESGLKLFSEHGIESVSMNAVAAAAGVGPTTLFKYFHNKEQLVIAISGMAWKNVWLETLSQYGEKQFSEFTAYKMIRIYTSSLIHIYQEHPEILRFSGNYKTFICHQRTKAEDLGEHLEPLKPIQTMFHQAYIRAKTDHSIRTDISEDVLFTSVAIGMLAIAERYAQGIIWANHGGENHIQELEIVQEMILNWCAGENADVTPETI